MNPDTLTINGEEYVRRALTPAKGAEGSGMRYCIVRTRSAGVFAGYLPDGDMGKASGTVHRARRLWYWSGAASLSELAVRGVADPHKCKFPCEVDRVILTEIIEVIPATEAARMSIEGVPEWTAH